MDRRSEGEWAERTVARRLVRDGWEVIRHGERIGGVQVDIVARRGGRVVLWEVKRRIDDRFPALGGRQHDRLMAAAGAWAARHPDDEVGLGLAVVTGPRWWPRVRLDPQLGAGVPAPADLPRRVVRGEE